MIFTLANAFSISSQSTLVQSFLYSSYGILLVLVALSCFYYERKGIFLSLIQLYSFIQFTFLLGSMSSRLFFMPFQLFKSSRSNFVSNCAEEAIIVSAILTILVIVRYSFKFSRKLVDLISVGMFLTIQDFIYYSSQNLKYLKLEGFENVLGFSFSVFYFSALLVFLGLLFYSLKNQKTLSSLIREDYKNSELYYLTLLFELILTPFFSFFISDQEIVKLSLIGAVEVGVSNN